MYRQVWVHNEDRRYQKFLWRNNESQEIKDFELKTVIFGSTSALMQIAFNHEIE